MDNGVKYVATKPLEEFACNQLETNLQPIATDCISRQAAIDTVAESLKGVFVESKDIAEKMIGKLPSVQSEIIRCKDCKYWRNQTAYNGAKLSFGFCESDDMWRSLYGETYEVAHIDTDDDFYCGYGERRQDG